jgi:hypothetical protein
MHFEHDQRLLGAGLAIRETATPSDGLHRKHYGTLPHAIIHLDRYVYRLYNRRAYS